MIGGVTPQGSQRRSQSLRRSPSLGGACLSPDPPRHLSAGLHLSPERRALVELKGLGRLLVLEQVARELEKVLFHLRRGRVEELPAQVHSVDALVGQPRMHLGFDTNGVVREEQRVNVEVERDRCVAQFCLLYTSPSPRDGLLSRMPSSA